LVQYISVDLVAHVTVSKIIAIDPLKTIRMERYVERIQKKPCFRRAFRAIKVPPRGVEQSHYSPGKMPIEDASGTVCGTVGAQNSLLDTWLNACPVELDDKRQEIIRQIAQWAAQ